MSETLEDRCRRELDLYMAGHQPDVSKALLFVNWSLFVTMRGNDGPSVVVAGWLLGDENVPHGETIYTHAVRWIDMRLRWCRTKNRIYRLGRRSGEDH